MGNPVKLMLGIFSVLFDVIFLTQHFILYRGMDPYPPLEGASVADPTTLRDNASSHKCHRLSFTTSYSHIKVV